jgi:hypothetical protein
MRRQLVYISGKYRARTIFGRIVNIWRAYIAARRLTKEGYVCIVPHLETALMDSLQSDDWFMEASLKKLRHCDALYLIKGWQESDGACLERVEAQKRGMKIWYEEPEIIRMYDPCIDKAMEESANDQTVDRGSFSCPEKIEAKEVKDG